METKQIAISGKVVSVGELRGVTPEALQCKLKDIGVMVDMDHVIAIHRRINEHKPTKVKLAREAVKQEQNKEKEVKHDRVNG